MKESQRNPHCKLIGEGLIFILLNHLPVTDDNEN